MLKDLYLDRPAREISLRSLKMLFRRAGAERLFVISLSTNDSSKRQIYFGGKPDDFHPIRASAWETVLGTSKKGTPDGPRYILRANVNLHWLDADGTAAPAPDTKIIMYPQYNDGKGEFRLSGFLSGASGRPSTLLSGERCHEKGRLLLLGATAGTRVLGFMAAARTPIGRETAAATVLRRIGSLNEISLPAKAAILKPRELLTVLGDIHRDGWLKSEMLLTSGERRSCTGRQSIGQTLLCALGVPADGRSAPDFHGWEVKSYTVDRFFSARSHRVSLMTTEPTGGYYAKHGPELFLRKYGWPRKTKSGFLCFTGPFVINRPHHRFKFVLEGYDPVSGRYTDIRRGLRLYSRTGALAAEWSFGRLMEHWHNKHNFAVYVPAQKDVKRGHDYFHYAPQVHLAQGNPFGKFLKALATGIVFYDPGTELNLRTRKPRGRNQLRALVPDALIYLYDRVDHCDVR